MKVNACSLFGQVFYKLLFRNFFGTIYTFKVVHHRGCRDIVSIVDDYGQWLATSEIPKMLIVAEPGALLHGRNLAFARTWKNQQEIVVKGIHYIQEDSPSEIGDAIRDFIDGGLKFTRVNQLSH